MALDHEILQTISKWSVSESAILTFEKEILIESRKLNKLQGLLQTAHLWPQIAV